VKTNDKFWDTMDTILVDCTGDEWNAICDLTQRHRLRRTMPLRFRLWLSTLTVLARRRLEGGAR